MRSLKQDIACHRALGNQMVKEHNLTNCSRMFKMLLVYNQYTHSAKIPTCRDLTNNPSEDLNSVWRIRGCDEDSNSGSSYKSTRSFSNLSDTCSCYSRESNCSSQSNSLSARKSPKSPSPLKRSFSQTDIDNVEYNKAHNGTLSIMRPDSSSNASIPLDRLQFELAQTLVNLVVKYRISGGAFGITQEFSDDFRNSIRILQPILQRCAIKRNGLEQFILERFKSQK